MQDEGRPLLGRRPLLVTGMPRSGTTWVARLLATAAGTALAGREPMNPRGRQYALGGSLDGWTRLRHPDARQRRALRRSYSGINPMVYSRYGRRQWAALLPWTRLVVKDPFAMLSMPTVVHATGAVPVLLYRHPAAALMSYRRMGWTADLDELRPLVRMHQLEGHGKDLIVQDLPRSGESSEAESMGRFWAALYTMAITDLLVLPSAAVVSHEDLAKGGPDATRELFAFLGLRSTERTNVELQLKSAAPPERTAVPKQLHDFSRSPRSVAGSWRSELASADLAAVEAVAADALDRLEGLKLDLGLSKDKRRA